MQWLSRLIDYRIDLTLRCHTFVNPHTISNDMHRAAAAVAVLGRNCRGTSLNPLILQTIWDFANRGRKVEQYFFQSNRVRLQVVKARFRSIRRKDRTMSVAAWRKAGTQRLWFHKLRLRH